MDALPFLRAFDAKLHGGHFGTGGTVFILPQTLVTAHGKEGSVLEHAGVGVVSQGIILEPAIIGKLDPASPVVTAIYDLAIMVRLAAPPSYFPPLPLLAASAIGRPSG